MSKLANSILAHKTDMHRALLSPSLCTIHENYTPIDSASMFDGVVYQIKVTLEQRAVIAAQGKIALAVDAARRAIIHEVFGEFSPHFHQIEACLWDHDIEAARRLLYAFREQMFNVD